jgi:hypothetical protein
VAAAFLRALLTRRVALSSGITLVVALLVTLLAVPGVWAAMRGLDGVRDGLKLAPGITEREKCLVDGGHPEVIGVARFLQKNVPPDARLAVRGGHLPEVCLQLSLLPRVMVKASEPHTYTLYYGDIPEGVHGLAYEKDAVLVKEGG